MADAVGAVIMTHTPAVTGVPVQVGQTSDTLQARIETKALDFDQIEWTKFVDKVFSQIEGRTLSPNLRLRVKGSDDLENEFELLDEIDLSKFNPADVRAPEFRFFKLEFIDFQITHRWRLTRFTVLGEMISEEG